MSVSVSMPQLGESVTEGTVTRWLKKEGERVEVDEPLLEVSTDKVDTEIPSPASGILRGIAVDEDETVAVGAQLAVIDDGESGDAAPPAADSAGSARAEAAEPAPSQPERAPASSDGWASPNYAPPAAPPASSGFSAAPRPSTPAYAPPPAYGHPQPAAPYTAPAPAYGQPAPAAEPTPASQVPAQAQPSPAETAPAAAPAAQAAAPSVAAAPAEEYPASTPLPGGGEAPYVTPLVRKLAAGHAVNLDSITGTGVGGRIRKQDVIEAARAQRQQPEPAQPPQVAQQPQAPQAPQEVHAAAPAAPAPRQAPAPAPRPAVVPSSLRGTTQRMSRPRQVIAQRMVESLRVSAQLTTVVEADVTAIARLRDLAKHDFEAREGVKLSFLPFFALAAVEGLKVHPKLNAVIDGDQVTYHDAEHLGIAVDTERGLMVPVIH